MAHFPASRCHTCRRFGAWRKMRVNRGQEVVIGGYTPSDRNFDGLIFGYYDNLPEARSGIWGAGLKAAKMKDCRRVKPILVGNLRSRNGRQMVIRGTHGSSG